jgi:hypothetical protein
MSYLRYLCLLTYSGVQHILCCVSCFVCLRLVFYVHNVASYSGLSNRDCQLLLCLRKIIRGWWV